MQADLFIRVSEPKPALKYVLDFVFNEFFGLSYQVILSDQECPDSSKIISYGLKGAADGVRIGSSGYIFQQNLLDHPNVELISDAWKGLPIFFAHSYKDLPFDLFGAIFFLLARVEEYGDFQGDVHNRFTAADSIFKDSDILDRPIIDEWLKAFGEILKERIPGIKLKENSFRWINTFDIDVAFAYKNRNVKRIFGGALKDLINLDLGRFWERIQVLSGGTEDPYDTFAFQRELSTGVADQMIYFFLVGGDSKYDNGLSSTHPGMRKLIQDLSADAEIGLHPSYDSMYSLATIKQEKQLLESSLEKSITQSRQHFLRMRLPDTYSALEGNGIQIEYTMGFVDRPGFRSGTARNHFFFNISTDRISDLRIVPLHIMDGTLRDYLKLNPNEAKEVLFELVRKVNSVGGDFVSLWHNDVIADRPQNEWRQLYKEMVKLIKELKAKNQNLD